MKSWLRFACSTAGAVAMSFALSACSHTVSSGASPSTAPQSGGLIPQTATSDGGRLAKDSSVPVRLASYNIDRSKVFVAGISSGGFFGVQMHVAHSATFKGAAIYAGGVYWCPGYGQAAAALTFCGGLTNATTGQASYGSTLAQSEQYLDQQSNLGTIDNESNLRGQWVYLWSGKRDQTVNPQEMADLNTEYRHYGAFTVFDNSFPANHGWESPNGEVPCGTAASPYMISCSVGSGNYDSERSWLSLLLNRVRPRNNGPLSGSLLKFDQTEFGAAASNSMDTTGWVFVPKACAQGSLCSLVLAFHGCLQNQALIGNKFVTEAGINEWADTNNIVVLYPYAIQSQTVPYNPQGCWDWWGYDDPNYALKSGTQISIVYKMVQRVMH